MTRILPSGSDESNSRDESASDGERRGSADGGRIKKLALALAVGAVAYLLVRRRLDRTLLERGESGSADREDGDLEGARRIPIDGSSSESVHDEESDGDEVDGSDSEGSLTDRSDAEIDERAETDVQEAPAEPGEMTIDEDVADEVVDDDSGENDDNEHAETDG